jgi:hypothetical protein
MKTPQDNFLYPESFINVQSPVDTPENSSMLGDSIRIYIVVRVTQKLWSIVKSGVLINGKYSGVLSYGKHDTFESSPHSLRIVGSY